MKLESRLNELELLGLKPSEKKILSAISKMAKYPEQIARHTGISRTSVDSILKRLKEKSYVVCIVVGKKKFWKSNILNIFNYLKNLQNETIKRKENGI